MNCAPFKHAEKLKRELTAEATRGGTTQKNMINHLSFYEKRKYKHVYDEPLLRGVESTCKHCGIKVTPLLELPYFEFTTKEGEYGDTQYERLPQCVGKKVSASQSA